MSEYQSDRARHAWKALAKKLRRHGKLVAAIGRKAHDDCMANDHIVAGQRRQIEFLRERNHTKVVELRNERARREDAERALKKLAARLEVAEAQPSPAELIIGHIGAATRDINPLTATGAHLDALADMFGVRRIDYSLIDLETDEDLRKRVVAKLPQSPPLFMKTVSAHEAPKLPLAKPIYICPCCGRQAETLESLLSDGQRGCTSCAGR